MQRIASLLTVSLPLRCYDRLGEATLFFEWLLANRQNSVEWVALTSAAWPEECVRTHVRIPSGHRTASARYARPALLRAPPALPLLFTAPRHVSRPAGFADSPLRISRWRQVTDLAHAFGLEAGLDVQIALQQQHSWCMLDAADLAPKVPLAVQLAKISVRG